MKDPSSTSFRSVRLLETRGPRQEDQKTLPPPAEEKAPEPEKKSRKEEQAAKKTGLSGLFSTARGFLSRKQNKKNNKEELLEQEKAQKRALHKVSGARRFLLTGTPVQNEVRDLWALMDICKPGALGNLATFTKNFINPIRKWCGTSGSVSVVHFAGNLAWGHRAILKLEMEKTKSRRNRARRPPSENERQNVVSPRRGKINEIVSTPENVHFPWRNP